MFKRGVSILLVLVLLLGIPVSSHALEPNVPFERIIEEDFAIASISLSGNTDPLYVFADNFNIDFM